MKRTIALITALTFLVSSVSFAADPSTLAPALKLGAIGDKHSKNFVLAAMGLSMELEVLDRSRDIDEAVSAAVIREALEKRDLHTKARNFVEYAPGRHAKVTAYFNRVEHVGAHIFTIPVSVTRYGRRYNYKLLFSTIRNDDGRFPTVLCRQWELAKLKVAISAQGRLSERALAEPKAMEIQRQLTAARAFSRSSSTGSREEIEETMRKFFEKKVKEGESFTCAPDMVIGLVTVALPLEFRLAALGLRHRKGIISSLIGKKLIFVHADSSELPGIRLPDPENRERAVKIYSNTTLDKIYIALDSEEWALFNSIKETLERRGRIYRSDRRRYSDMAGDADLLLAAGPLLTIVEERLIHEIGKMCGLSYWARESGGEVYHQLDTLTRLIPLAIDEAGKVEPLPAETTALRDELSNIRPIGYRPPAVTQKSSPATSASLEIFEIAETMARAECYLRGDETQKGELERIAGTARNLLARTKAQAALLAMYDENWRGPLVHTVLFGKDPVVLTEARSWLLLYGNLEQQDQSLKALMVAKDSPDELSLTMAQCALLSYVKDRFTRDDITMKDRLIAVVMDTARHGKGILARTMSWAEILGSDLVSDEDKEEARFVLRDIAANSTNVIAGTKAKIALAKDTEEDDISSLLRNILEEVISERDADSEGRTSSSGQKLNDPKLFVIGDRSQSAEWIARQIIEEVKNNPDTVLGLATGGTPAPVYEWLIKITEKESVDWSRVRTFNLDEYYGIPVSHPQSYRSYMNNNLFTALGKAGGIKLENTHVPNSEAENPEEEMLRYVEMIRKEGGVGLWLIGIGRDRHYAFFEPGADIGLEELSILGGRIDYKNIENPIVKKARDFNEFVISEELGSEYSGIKKVVKKLLKLQAKCRGNLLIYDDLIRRYKKVIYEQKLEDVSDKDAAAEMVTLSEKMLNFAEVTFYVPISDENQRARLESELRSELKNQNIRILHKDQYFASAAKVVSLALPTVIDNSRYFESIAEVPSKALTVTGIVRDSRWIIQYITNPDMAEAIECTLKLSYMTAECPSVALRTNPEYTIVTTEEVASKIPEGLRKKYEFRASSAGQNAIAAKDIVNTLPREFSEAPMDLRDFAQAVEDTGSAALFEDTDRERAGFIFSTKVTFDNGFGAMLPKLAESGIKIGVVAANERQEALIMELNEGRPENYKIVCASSVAAVKSLMGSARYYYFKVKDEPAEQGVRNIELIVEQIISALGRITGVTNSLLIERMREAACRFAEAA